MIFNWEEIGEAIESMFDQHGVKKMEGENWRAYWTGGCMRIDLRLPPNADEVDITINKEH